jgi:hypothetical protein
MLPMLRYIGSLASAGAGFTSGHVLYCNYTRHLARVSGITQQLRQLPSAAELLRGMLLHYMLHHVVL